MKTSSGALIFLSDFGFVKKLSISSENFEWVIFFSSSIMVSIRSTTYLRRSNFVTSQFRRILF